ncbi:hypothetical protein NN561_015019 [Cricetulus griseus]
MVLPAADRGKEGGVPTDEQGWLSAEGKGTGSRRAKQPRRVAASALRASPPPSPSALRALCVPVSLQLPRRVWRDRAELQCAWGREVGAGGASATRLTSAAAAAGRVAPSGQWGNGKECGGFKQNSMSLPVCCQTPGLSRNPEQRVLGRIAKRGYPELFKH